MQDYSEFLGTVAIGQPRVSELVVLKGGLEHYDVLASAATSFGKALEKEFSLDKVNTDTFKIFAEQTRSQVHTTAAELEASGVLPAAGVLEDSKARRELLGHRR